MSRHVSPWLQPRVHSLVTLAVRSLLLKTGAICQEYQLSPHELCFRFQANRIAFGARRFRVVTLAGEMIETSGAMSGGGNEKLRGKMGTQVSRRDSNDPLNKIDTDKK